MPGGGRGRNTTGWPLGISASAIASNEALGGHGGADGPGISGGVYNLGTFVCDAATVIAHNHASTSNDDCFGC
jgi:hypothetical protein